MSEHTISFVALIVSVIGFIATLFISLSSNRKSRESIEISRAAETRASLAEARSTERSQVLWNACLTTANVVALQNWGSDAAHDVRITYKIMNVASEEDPGWPLSRVVSARAHELPTDPTTHSMTLQAVKTNIIPRATIGLPIPPGIGFDFTRAQANNGKFRLLLEIEWRTEAGSAESETLYAPLLGVIFSHLEFPSFQEYASRFNDDEFEALSPINAHPTSDEATERA